MEKQLGTRFMEESVANMSAKKIDKFEEIDIEWLHLIIEAKKMGLSTQEIREFLKTTHPNRNK